jgi:oligosaccharide translocation protein RFT1
MAELRTNVRVRAEGLGITGKTVVTFLVLVYDSRREERTLALLAFATGQLAYGIIVLGAYLACYGTGNLSQRTFRIKCVGGNQFVPIY